MKNFPEKNVVYILRPAITELQVWLWQKTIVAKTGNHQNRHKIQNIARTRQQIITKKLVLVSLIDF